MKCALISQNVTNLSINHSRMFSIASISIDINLFYILLDRNDCKSFKVGRANHQEYAWYISWRYVGRVHNSYFHIVFTSFSLIFSFLFVNNTIGLAKILLGKGPTKETAFLDVSPIHLEVCIFPRILMHFERNA